MIFIWVKPFSGIMRLFVMGSSWRVDRNDSSQFVRLDPRVEN